PEPRAVSLAFESLGTFGDLEKGFARRNRGLRVARVVSSLMVSVIMGSLFFRISMVFAPESWQASFDTWGGAVFSATLVFAPSWWIAMGMRGLTRRFTSGALSPVLAGLLGALSGLLCVFAWAFVWSDG